MSDDVEGWVRAINARPALYRLNHYGPSLTTERTAELFARWAAAEAGGESTPALCRRCGRILRETFRPHQQLHVRCWPPEP